ncbi:AI-2E family transporter [Bdellovibrio svalbardensis]|uniref:AI-2E family transporter n=1 Tax=Bdellovibrio svalbardensis TaxID=2972972 RepID=A0ABT6DHV0_9BACT|nr:AI-2E family transporter [Bdellovibrio svalbardensis]MDG0816402.1 AI-2E family transporter [Bdellovibrio svalbardensis]
MVEALRNKSHWVIGIVLFALFAVFFYINFPFLLPFILAGIFALALNDFINRQAAKRKLPRWAIITLVMLTGLATFWIPICLATYRIVNVVKVPDHLSSGHVSEQVTALKNFAVGLVQKFSDFTGVDMASPVRDTLDNLLHKIGVFVFEASSNFLSSAPSVIFNTFVFLLFVVVLLSQAGKLKEFVIKYSPIDEPLTKKFIAVLKVSCSTTLFSTFVIGVIQATIIGLGSLIFNEGDFWIVTPITFVLSFIPVIGAAPVGFVLAILAFIGGRTGSGIGMVAFSIVGGTIDNVLKPIMVGGKDLDISPVIGFTCVVGAIIMMGLPGLLIGPVIMNVFARMTPLLLSELKQK